MDHHDEREADIDAVSQAAHEWVEKAWRAGNANAATPGCVAAHHLQHYLANVPWVPDLVSDRDRLEVRRLRHEFYRLTGLMILLYLLSER